MSISQQQTNKQLINCLDMTSLFGVIVVCVIGLILSLIAFAAEFYISWQHRMILLRLKTRRAIMDPLHLMGIANLRASRILADEEANKHRRRSEFHTQSGKIFPAGKKKKKRLIDHVDAEDDV